MSYRNIKVNDVDYRYVIGKKVTKVQKVGETNFKLFDNEMIGNKLGKRVVITPAVIRDAILGNPLPRQMKCNCHGVTTDTFALDPYEKEINDVNKLIINCPECISELEMDI